MVGDKRPQPEQKQNRNDFIWATKPVRCRAIGPLVSLCDLFDSALKFDKQIRSVVTLRQVSSN